jgi:hypothetical protein
MRHLHTDSHFRLAIAALQDSGGYVDTLLGLARDQIMARQPLISRRHARPRGNLVPRNRSVGSLTFHERPRAIQGARQH